jgi:hypothetical protein
VSEVQWVDWRHMEAQ